ncbi:MAG: 5'/3'-nucleotidase SurE [Candidatus Xenobia bacterium]
MRILVSNDDGVFAEGLLALVEELRQLGHVTVIAPDRERSATGHSLTFFNPLRLHRVRQEPNLDMYACDGTPTDCILLGIYDLMKDARPDVAISGINRGANLGDDITYSGTVAAAMEALIHGIPSFAMSLAAHQETDFRYAAEFARQLAPVVVEKGLPPKTFLNVNVPNVPRDQVRAVRITTQGHSIYDQRLIKRLDPRGTEYYWITGAIPTGEPLDGTDFAAIFNNEVSITPMQLNLTNRDSIASLETWPLKV